MNDDNIEMLWRKTMNSSADRAPMEFARALIATAVADERERSAVAAWNHYMETCSRLRLSPADFEHWNAARAVRSEGT